MRPKILQYPHVHNYKNASLHVTCMKQVYGVFIVMHVHVTSCHRRMFTVQFALYLFVSALMFSDNVCQHWITLWIWILKCSFFSFCDPHVSNELVVATGKLQKKTHKETWTLKLLLCWGKRFMNPVFQSWNAFENELFWSTAVFHLPSLTSYW